MSEGKKVTLENQTFLIGIPTGGTSPACASFWGSVLPYLPSVSQYLRGIGCICRERGENGYCVVRGEQDPENRLAIESFIGGGRNFGFQPMLSPRYSNGKPNASLLRDVPAGTVIHGYSLLKDGKPVRTDSDVPQRFAPSSELAFVEEYYRREYEIPWVVVDGSAISARVLLTHISWDQLHKQGYC